MTTAKKPYKIKIPRVKVTNEEVDVCLEIAELFRKTE